MLHRKSFYFINYSRSIILINLHQKKGKYHKGSKLDRIMFNVSQFIISLQKVNKISLRVCFQMQFVYWKREKIFKKQGFVRACFYAPQWIFPVTELDILLQRENTSWIVITIASEQKFLLLNFREVYFSISMNRYFFYLKTLCFYVK